TNCHLMSTSVPLRVFLIRGSAGEKVLAKAARLPHNTARSRRSPSTTQLGASTMKTGMNLLLWTTHVTAEHFPILGKLKKAGFDGVELPIFEGDTAHYQGIRKELDKQGLRSTAVTIVSEQANPISPDAAVREAAVERLRWAIDMTAAVGGEYLCGPFHSPLAVLTGRGPTADEKKWAADVLRRAADHAQKAGITLAIEYLNRFECYFLTTAVEARALVKAVNHPHFRMMYDTFHANIEEKNIP